MNTIILPKAQAIRYLGLLIWVAFMIMSIRVYVNNYLTIQDRITQTQQDIVRTQSETDFIRNFELPYLQTDLAQQNIMHQHQIINKWGKLIMFTYQSNEQSAEQQKTIDKWWDTLKHEWWLNFIVYQWRKSINQ